MNSSPLERQSALERLAAQLDDETLCRLFPGYPPGDVRQLIGGAVARLPRAASATGQDIAPSSGAAATRCRLFTDGASRGNPGEAGAGIVLQDSGGRELLARGQYLGRMTNNAAEYQALLLGLEAAMDLGCPELDIFLDSELIVRQIEGRYRVKNHTLLPLFQQVRQRLQHFRRWRVSHVPREQNRRADEMANQGIDNRDRQS